ncbi:hypothetical protein Sjap_023647 [Stephania japonica]|uniref:Uncharacterized protein n=1 Tax=Stephania japonica TaxID=461633 RepID=A0AAP0EE39_9MAGN
MKSKQAALVILVFFLAAMAPRKSEAQLPGGPTGQCIVLCSKNTHLSYLECIANRPPVLAPTFCEVTSLSASSYACATASTAVTILATG